MNLPNAIAAYVEERKIREYLLSFSSEDGQHKAAFFSRFGFTAASPEEFAAALREHGMSNQVAMVEENAPFGTTYVVEGRLSTPTGRNPMVRTVWEVRIPGASPRLITAYPA